MAGIKRRTERSVKPWIRYSPPSNAVVFTPADAPRIPATVAAAEPGTVFYFRRGEYRGVNTIAPKSRQVFIGEIGQDGSRLATFIGSTVLQNWSFADGLWSCAVSAPRVFEPHGSFRPGYAGNGMLRPLYLNGKFLQRKLTVAELREAGSGWWAWDQAAGRVYMVDDPTGQAIEMGTTQYPFRYSSGIDGVELYGITFLRYGNHCQMGVLGGQFPAARNWIVEYCEVSWCKGTGINAGPGWKVRHCVANYNGHEGIGSGSNTRRSGVQVIGCEMGWNNQLKVNEEWGAGAGKFATTDGLIVRGCFVHDNDGRGIWTDIDNNNVLIEDNVCSRNLNEGIMHEISQSAIIRNNLCGLNGRDGGWGYGPQILISASGPATVEGNVCEVAGDYGLAVSILQQSRGTSSVTGQLHQSTNAVVRNNQFIYRESNSRPSGLLRSSVVFVSDVPGLRPEDTAAVQENQHIIEPGASQARIFWRNSYRTPEQLQALTPAVAVGDRIEESRPSIRYDYGWVDGYLQPLGEDPVMEELQRQIDGLTAENARLKQLSESQAAQLEQLNKQLTQVSEELTATKNILAAESASNSQLQSIATRSEAALKEANEKLSAATTDLTKYKEFFSKLKELLAIQ